MAPSRLAPPCPRDPRRGMTLVELLVVVAIVVLLMAFAAPLLKLALADRKVRESTRILGIYFNGAQARAAELGRPVGVWIERRTVEIDEGGGPVIYSQALQCYTAVVPPPYAGDTLSAGIDPSFDFTANFTAATATTPWSLRVRLAQASLLRQPLIQTGDTIQFNYQGHRYRIRDIHDPQNASSPPAGTCVIIPEPSPDRSLIPEAPPPTHLRPGMPFQVTRQPRRSAVNPIELPAGLAIDLQGSGIGPFSTNFATLNANDTAPVVVMFSPAGYIDRVYVDNQSFRPNGDIFLLLGNIERPTSENLQDPGGRWVVIGHRSGRALPGEFEMRDPDTSGGETLVGVRRELARQAVRTGTR